MMSSSCLYFPGLLEKEPRQEKREVNLQTHFPFLLFFVKEERMGLWKGG